MNETRPFSHLVVVGSSAGGVEALGNLVSGLPKDFGAPLVVAQHLDPKRTSHLGEILERRSQLPVRSVEGEEALEPGVVYVVPANRHVLITDHSVRVEPTADTGPRPSIDRLFESAATQFGDGLIAVILTGIGSDGAAGARYVKEHGGTVVIQDPATAAFPSMPQSLAPSTVDVVTDIEKIGGVLDDLVNERGAPTYGPDAAGARELRAFLEQLRARSGIDFNSYKMPTITRRLQRRIVATGAGGLTEYVRYLQSHPDEYQRLVSSFLIKVTQFFRDADLFDYLRERIVPELIADARQRGGELRIWSAGCATGEEAYSLAILICEALGAELDQFKVRLFATDLDLDAVAFARRGIYPASALSEMPPELAERYFTRSDGEFEIRKSVRSMMVFGQHDLGQRSPFPHIDLALCRNVLIYFTGDLQKRALQLFAFSLRMGGYLVLGQAESTSALPGHFVQESARLKLYRRAGERVLIPPARIIEAAPGAQQRTRLGRRVLGGLDAMRLAREAAHQPTSSERAESYLFRLPIGVAIVDRRYDILTINNAARELFGIHGTALGEDFVHLARGFDAGHLRSAIDTAFRGEVAQLDDIPITEPGTGAIRRISVACHPDRTEGADAPINAVIVTGQDASEAVGRIRELEEHASRLGKDATRVAGLMERLAEENRRLLAANRELTVAGAELRSANEEFLIDSEEMQAAAEEVETLNEELQATNEELETLNEELQATVEELNTTNDDLQARSLELQELTVSLESQQRGTEGERARLDAIVSSMADAVLVVDPKGDRVLTNAAYDSLFGGGGGEMVPTDGRGRPIPADQRPQCRTARGESFRTEFTLRAADGKLRWFEASGRPIVQGGRPHGGVVVIRDLSEASMRRFQEELLATVTHELRTPLTVLEGYLQMIERHRTNPTNVAEYAARGREQGRRLEALLEELSDATRTQSGQLTLARERVDLRALVERSVETARSVGDGQTIELEASAHELFVDADPRRLEQVMLNLLTNAIRHADSDRIDVRLRAVGERAEVQVEDYGRGIPAADLPHAFTRYFRPADTPTRRVGLGLGLYISHQIVEAHGGTIEVSSQPRKGTRFTVTLPRAS